MASKLAKFQEFIETHYNLEDLQIICLDLGIIYYNLRGETLSSKASDLILKLGWRRQLDRLLRALQQDRREAFAQVGICADLDVLYAELPAFGASEPLSALLTPEAFTKRMQRADLVKHEVALVGRQDVLRRLDGYLENKIDIVILHGPGGVGKTRLLLALPDIVPNDVQVLYTRTEAETVESDLALLDQETQYVIGVDDAHRFEPLPHLQELLINPDFAGKVKLVLTTRSVFRELVTYRFSQTPGNQVAEVEIDSLPASDLDGILHSPPYEIEESVRHTLVAVSDGNPLIALMGAELVRRGDHISKLTRDQVLTRYLDDLVHDLAEVGFGDRYICYLEVLAALDTLDLSNETLRSRVQQVVGISQIEEDRMVARLVGAGLIERYWMTLKMSSEVLSDHILVSHFFDSETKCADYQSQIIGPFLQLKPKEILTRLAEAEVKGESQEAGFLLGNKLDELYRIVESDGNVARLVVLDWLQDVAYLRPDDAMGIVARIVNGPELQPETYHDRVWGPYEVDHSKILSRAVDVTSRAKYLGVLKDVITYLQRIATYREMADEYGQVREKARKELVEIARFEPRKPYTVQLTMAEMIPDWLTANFPGNLDLVLDLVPPMLSMQFQSAETDPTKPFRIIVHSGVLGPVDPLRQLRDQVLDILYAAYHQASSLSERLKTVKALDGAVPLLPPDASVPDETRDWLQPDCQRSAQFFSQCVVPTAELPVLDAVHRWLGQAERWNRDVKELEHLRAQLQTHRLYQLYYLLVGRYRWEAADNRLDWQKTEERRREALDCYIERLSEETLDQSVCDLDIVAAQAREAGEGEPYWLNHLFVGLGERKPAVAQRIVEIALAQNLALGDHLGYILAGLRVSAPESAEEYIEAWASGSTPVLWLAVVRSYRFVDWKTAGDRDQNILRQLVACDSQSVDHEIIWLLRDLAPFVPALGVELLKTIADRGDNRILSSVAETLSWPHPSRDGYAVEFANSQDYLDIVQNFERLASLDYVEKCLDRMGQVAPMQVIDFVERRVRSTEVRQALDKSYDAIPFQFSRAMDAIRSSPEYLDVLRRVRDWMLEPSWRIKFEVPRLLRHISGGLGAPLNQVLMEWVDSGEECKLNAVAEILREFNTGQPFYMLSREIICRTDDETTLGSIVAAIGSTPGAQWGKLSAFTKRRLDEVSPWLQDEDLRVRRFADRMTRSLQRTIEREQAEEDWEKRNW